MVRTRVPSPQGQLAAQYAELWPTGANPSDLLQFLEGHHAEPADQLFEVLLLDQQMTWESGGGKSVEWYRDRWPTLDGKDAWLLELISGEYRQRARRGAAPTTEELEHRFPTLAPQLSRQFAQTLDPTTRVPGEVGSTPPAIGSTPRGTLQAPRRDVAPLSDPPEAPGSTRPVVDPLRVIGRTIEDRYTITGYIGKGGFGAVYDARDRRFAKLEDDTSKVAIKLMTSFGVDFAREAHLIKLFKHPHVVEVYDFGVEGDYLAWLVMEFLPGMTLRDAMVLAPGPQPDSLIRKFVQECGPALQHAHTRNLVHRDLKPQNIMLVHAGQAGEYFKILDFGISTKGDAQDDLVNRTMAGAGTPEYMSPEQVRAGSGAGAGATPLSDIYTFGVLLFELLTGRVPFPLTGYSPLAISKCYLDVINLPPPRFADVAPARWKAGRGNPGGGAIETLVRQCLEKDPAQRPKSMQEVQTRFLNAFQSEQRPPVRSWGWIAALLLVAAALPPAAWWMIRPNDRPVDLLHQQLEVVAGESERFDLLRRSPEFTTPVKLTIDNPPAGVQIAQLPGDGQSFEWIQISADLNAPAQESTCKVRVESMAEPGSAWDFEMRLRVQKPYVWLPDGGRFKPADDPQTRIVRAAGHNFYNRLRGDIKGQQVTFLFIPPTATLQPFYIMEDKVSRGLFESFLQAGPKLDAKRLPPTAVIPADWPVTNLTVDGAHACAVWLGGSLPTPEQWDAAAGRYDTPLAAGPFQGQWSETSRLKIAVGLSEPWPIGAATDDVSPHGCRDMSGNGLEFTREVKSAEGNTLTAPISAPKLSDTVTMRGRSYDALQPLTFQELGKDAWPYPDPCPTAGFRVVLVIP